MGGVSYRAGTGVALSSRLAVHPTSTSPEAMTRTRTLTLVPALLLLVGVERSALPADGTAEPRPSEVRRGSGVADPRVDSARAELAAQRPWHAARLLRAVAAQGPSLGPEETLLLARADAGWRNWAGVVEQLDAKPWLAQTAGGEGWLLLARAREERKEWPQAADGYERWFAL